MLVCNKCGHEAFLHGGNPGEVVIQCKSCNHFEVKEIEQLDISGLVEAVKYFADGILSFYRLTRDEKESIAVDEFNEYLFWDLNDFEKASRSLIERIRILKEVV